MEQAASGVLSASQPIRGVRCLVLGAGGFLGLALSRVLAASGAIVTGFGRSVRFPRALDSNIAWREGRLSDSSALTKAVANQEVVFHLIGDSNPESSNRDPIAECADNVLATLRLLEVCRAEGVRKIIFGSSGGAVYGPPTQIPIPEISATNPISAYGISKLTIEKHLALYHYLHGLDYHVLRMANP